MLRTVRVIELRILVPHLIYMLCACVSVTAREREKEGVILAVNTVGGERGSEHICV